MAGEDYVQVQLTAAGVEMAGTGKYVRVLFANSDLTFDIGKPLRVTRFEWSSLRARLFKGQPIFEVVPSGAPAAAAAPAPSPSPAAPAAVAPNHPSKIWPPEPTPASAEEKH